MANTLATTGIVADGVWKKFHRGEVHDSLRDLIPAVARRLTGRAIKRSELGADDFWSVRDVSFRVEPGQALGIIGPNGAGKSTTLRILTGIMRPDRGSVEIRGRLRALIEVAAGFHPDLTGRENIFLNGAILGMTTGEVASRMDEIIDFSGIEPFLDTPVKRYSSGMMARLGFSVAAHMDPEVLLVDEILSVGDLAFQKKCYSYMQGLSARGVAVVFVSHNMPAIARLCQNTMVLHEGAIRFLGSTDEAQHAYYSLLDEQSARKGESAGPTLESFEIRDSEGRPKRVFVAGERCTVRAIVRADRAYPRFSLGLSLAMPSGEEVFHTTSQRLHESTVDARSGDLIEMEADLAMNLAGGSQTVYVQCHDYSGSPSEVHRMAAMEIHVQKTPDFGGIAYLDPRLRLRKVESPAGEDG
ncbi:MAG: ABC transporter ATP-binding protein [Gemmatimonadota bacterium]|nr:ABC transporter ATP-binding protein [Gemmatimonadota bacterium]